MAKKKKTSVLLETSVQCVVSQMKQQMQDSLFCKLNDLVIDNHILLSHQTLLSVTQLGICA